MNPACCLHQHGHVPLRTLQHQFPEGRASESENTNVFINIYQTILLKIIKMWEINAYNLTQIVNDLCEISTYEKMSNIIDFIDELYSKVDDVPAFLKIVQLLITKINKNPILLKNKLVSNYNYEDLTIENCDNFVNNILE